MINPHLQQLRARPMTQDKANTLLLLCTCLLVLLPYAAHVPLWVSSCCAVFLGWRGWVAYRGIRLPPRWLLWSVAVGVLGAIALQYRTVLGREAGIALLLLLLTLKLLEVHIKRDLFVVLFLSYFLLLAQFFYSQSILRAVYTIALVVLILTTQTAFQYTGKIPLLTARLRTSAFCVALAIPLMMVLFVFFPRLDSPLWGLPADARAGKTGLSETMEPGSIASLALSNEIAFRVKFNGPPPPRETLYWRGIVLSHFDGRVWRERVSRQPPQVEIDFLGVPVQYQVTLEPHGKSWIFALDLPRNVPILDNNFIRTTHELQLTATSPIHQRIRYDASSHPNYRLQTHLDPEALTPWLALPPDFNPRTLALAERMRSQHRGSSEPLALVAAALRTFKEEGFSYTLQPPRIGYHAVDDFLFETRAGFCEHYAGAFVFLMRAAGIPARVVTGYLGGEMNPADGFMAVRQADAHAWAEVWIASQGWLRIDPTAVVAPERIQQNLSAEVPTGFFNGLFTLNSSDHFSAKQLQRLRYSWEAVNNSWNQWVLTYSASRQKNLLQRLGLERIEPAHLALLAILCATVVGLLSVAVLALRQTKRDPLTTMYASLHRTLKKHGVQTHAHEGPRALRERLANTQTTIPASRRDAAIRFLTAYEDIRYGMPHAAQPTLSDLKKLLSETK